MIFFLKNPYSHFQKLQIEFLLSFETYKFRVFVFSDQLEKDFETSGSGLHDVRLDTPPDSDSENSEYLNQLLDDGILTNEVQEAKDQLEAPVAAAGYDLLNSAKLSLKPISLLTSAASSPSVTSSTTFALPKSPPSVCLKRASSQSVDSLMHDATLTTATTTLTQHRVGDSCNVVQSPGSVAKVGKLPAETMAVLNKLPAKIFLPSSMGSEKDSPRVIDVVKVGSKIKKMLTVELQG